MKIRYLMTSLHEGPLYFKTWHNKIQLQKLSCRFTILNFISTSSRSAVLSEEQMVESLYINVSTKFIIS